MEGDYKDTNLEDNVTKDAWFACGLEPNRKNKIVDEIIEKNPLKSLFDERNDPSLEQMSGYVKKAKESIDSMLEVLPTCGELSEKKELVMLFRTTSKIVGAGEESPFNELSLIVGPKGVFLIRNLGKYGKRIFEGSIDVSRPSEGGVSKNLISIDSDVRKLIESFEQNPSVENKGKLLEAYEKISSVVSRTSNS